MIRSIFLAAASVMATASAPPSNEAIVQAQPVADAFYAAVVACGRKPPFKPAVELATAAGATRYDPRKRAVVIVPYDVVDPGTRAAMERFAAIGTLGLSGQQQYVEIFNNLLVAHELGHWIQEVARRPLTRWQAEYEANRMMVAFWRDHPAGAPTERRLANFVAQRAPAPDLVPKGIEAAEAVSCYPFLDHLAGRHPASAGSGGPCAADRFTKDIGGLLPIALCGLTSL